jgi:hypothetical protein
MVIVDQAGGVHSLARRIDTMKAADLRSFMAPLDQSSLPNVEEARASAIARHRQTQQAEADGKLEKAYSRGGDYVSQSHAALAEHKRRQSEIDRREGRDSTWDRIEAGEKERERIIESRSISDPEPRETGRRDDTPTPDIEMTDAMQARLDRLRDAKAGLSKGPDGVGGRPTTPGGGHTRSR